MNQNDSPKNSHLDCHKISTFQSIVFQTISIASCGLESPSCIFMNRSAEKNISVHFKAIERISNRCLFS